MDEERRQYRRLNLRLPVEYYPSSVGREGIQRTVSANISAGGVYFEVPASPDAPAPEVSSLLNIELTIPPGDGYFPYEGRVKSMAEVIRCHPLPAQSADANGTPRYGIAARFRDTLELAFA